MMVGMADQTVGTSPPSSRMWVNTSNRVMAAGSGAAWRLVPSKRGPKQDDSSPPGEASQQPRALVDQPWQQL